MYRADTNNRNRVCRPASKLGSSSSSSDKLGSAEAVIANPILHINDSDSIPANIFLTTFIA